MNVATSAVLAHSWLLLIHQIPAKPAYLRVKIWRRLQGIGAIAVKNAVHVLPMNEETQEDFEWLLREIEQGGGEALICEARLIDGLSDQEIRALFDKARDADYAQLVKDVRALAKSAKRLVQDLSHREKRFQTKLLAKSLELGVIAGLGVQEQVRRTSNESREAVAKIAEKLLGQCAQIDAFGNCGFDLSESSRRIAADDTRG